MAHTTLTLAASGRLNSTSLGGAPTTSTTVLIPSGMVGVMALATSMTAYNISCLGTGSARGFLALPANAGYLSVLKISIGGTINFGTVNVLERTTGTTGVPKSNRI